jgi:hypothetical protein
MAVINLTNYKAYIDTNLNTNGVGSITGAMLNTALNYIADTLLWAEQRRAVGVALESGRTNDVLWTNDADEAHAFVSETKVALAGVRCYDDSGNNVDFQITAVDHEKMTIEPADDCSMDYVAIACGSDALPT